VRFIDDDHVPLGVFRGIKTPLVTRNKIDRRYEESLSRTRELIRFCLERASINQPKTQPKLILHLISPLASEATGRDDQDFADHAAEHEFLYEQPGHDCFSGSRVVGQEKTNSGQW
jgi:hypothetical protein